MAQEGWVRIGANRSLGAYEIFQATSNVSDPEWPEQPFSELIRIAFKNQFIDSIDHPVIRDLLGERRRF